MKKAVLKMSGIRLKPSQVHKMRGFVGDVFKEHDLVHNHDVETGKVIYRYPLIQFKVIDNSPVIIALTEKAVNVFGEIFMKLDHIKIEDLTIPVNEKELSVEDNEFGIAETMIQYELIHPWVALNQENYREYQEFESFGEKKEML
ncbi:MAG TPA: DNA repair protein, partial [bacterium]|nr:DNA repair protein [bacterium]